MCVEHILQVHTYVHTYCTYCTYDSIMQNVRMFYVCAYLINTYAVVLCHIGSVVIDIGHIDTDGDACTARICLTHHPRCGAGCPVTSHHCQGEHVDCLPVKMLCSANMHDCRPLNAYTSYLLSCEGKDT